jgi:hypothetical protein
MEEEKYILVVAPSGLYLDRTIKKIINGLNAEVADVEAGIKKNPEIVEALNNMDDVYTKDTIDMGLILSNLPRSKIKSLWEASVKNCLESLANSKKSLKILSMHLMYNCKKRNEFYSVVNAQSLTLEKRDVKLSPSAIIVLIDDIYDVYEKLRGILEGTHLRDYAFRQLKGLSVAENALRISQWKIQNLIELLYWRYFETILAENLAHQFGLEKRYFVFAVKQGKEALRNLVANPGALDIYLSHPVRDARKLKNKIGSWPAFTSEVEELQTLFIQHSVSLLCPTAIDELRFNQNEQDSTYTGILDSRWPSTESKSPEDLLYVPFENNTDLNYTSFFKLEYYDKGKEALVPLPDESIGENLKTIHSNILQVLINTIEKQIASRDFLLVNYSKGVLVYRPYYFTDPRFSFSSGVDKEVKLWDDIIRIGEKKYIAFVHFENDVEEMLNEKFKLEINEELNTKKSREILAELADSLQLVMTSDFPNISKEITRTLLEEGKLVDTPEIFETQVIPPNIKTQIERSYSNFLKPMKAEYLKKLLINSVKSEELTAVWIVSDFNDLKKEIPSITSFLSIGDPKGNGWEKNVDKLLSNGLLHQFGIDL